MNCIVCEKEACEDSDFCSESCEEDHYEAERQRKADEALDAWKYGE